MQIEPYLDLTTQIFHKELFVLIYQACQYLFQYFNTIPACLLQSFRDIRGEITTLITPINTQYDDIEPRMRQKFKRFNSTFIPSKYYINQSKGTTIRQFTNHYDQHVVFSLISFYGLRLIKRNNQPISSFSLLPPPPNKHNKEK